MGDTLSAHAGSQRSGRSGWAKWILLGGLAASLGFFLLAWVAQKGRAKARFDVAVIEARGRLESRLRDCEDLLRGVRGHAQASGGVNKQSFRTFLQSLDLEKNFPGLLGVAYGIPLQPLGQEGVEKRLQMEHRRPVRIHPGVGFGDDAIILFEEPEEPNIRALGFNSASREDQRASLIATRDTGALRASPPLALAQAPEAGPGLVLRLAVYGGSVIPSTVEERRRAFSGYANAIFLLNSLAEDASTRASTDGIQLRLADLGDPDHPKVFHEGRNGFPRHWWHRFGPKGISRRETMEIGGRLWELRFEAGPSFFQAGECALPWLILLGGIQPARLLAALVRSINLTGLRAEEMAKKMTEELHRSESRLRAIARVMPDAILVLDAEGRYMEILTADPTRLAAPAEKLVGRKVEEILQPELAKSVLDCITRALQDRHIQSLEYELETPKGHLRFDARVAPMDVEIEGRPCVIWVARDVTERRAQEEALLQTQKLESLGVLAGGIAHDFNNLLAAIQGHLSLGRLVVEDGQDPLDHFDRMEASIRRAADLARQLLAYAGRGAFQVEPVDLNALVAEMSDILGVSRSKKVELEVRLAEALPLVRGDHAQLQQVVMNLVTNASESIGDRPGKVELTTGTVRLDSEALKRKFPGQNLEAGSFVTLTVKDDGSGMPPEILGKIFDPFFTTKPTGRGLGLSALQGILRGHKAGIEIQSEPGRGTCISLYFPATLADGTPLIPHKPVQGSGSELSGVLLLAEDEQTIRENSRQMAERLGFQVIEAADGEEAWSLFQAYESAITAVVLDLTMPRKGGAEVYGLIRARLPLMPVVLCSGYSREAIPEPTGNGEPRVFLQKPFSFRQFESSLREALALAALGFRR